MKRILILFVYLFFISNTESYCQSPVLDSANFTPKDGDTAFFWSGNITNYFNPGLSGANVVWDYSNINFTIPVSNPGQLYYDVLDTYSDSLILIDSNVTIISTPIVSNNPAGINMMYFVSSSVFSYNGYYSDCIYNLNSEYVPNKIIIKFPFTYSDYFSDSSIENSNSPNSTTTSHYYYSVKADAWGTLKLLNKIHYNTIRLMTTTMALDSSNTIIGYIDTSYTWYKSNYFGDLLEMSSFWHNNNGTLTNYKSSYISPYGLEYLPGIVGVKENKLSANISISPNPAKEFFKMNANERISSIEVLDFRGILLKTFLKPKQSDEYYIGDLAKGLYFVRIHADGMVNTLKLVTY
jgi:hypothetical protein